MTDYGLNDVSELSVLPSANPGGESAQTQSEGDTFSLN